MAPQQNSRPMSTDELLSVDSKFVPRAVKRSEDNFHKAGNTYYFPNGEIFRPRNSPGRKGRPSRYSKSNSLRGSYHYVPPAPSQVPDTITGGPYDRSGANVYTPSLQQQNNTGYNHGGHNIPRSASMVSINSSISIQSAPLFMPRSSSFTNVKKASQQHLAHSLRSNRLDTPTNISIQHLSPTTQHSPRMGAKPTFQSTNLLRNNSTLSITSGELVETINHHNSDSNPSSLSNYTLNRSMSNTPQTSINTSIDDMGAAVKPDPASDISKSNSLESIRETEVNTLTSNDAASSQKSTLIIKPVLSAVDAEDTSSFDSSGDPNLTTLEEEADKTDNTLDTHTVITSLSPKEPEYPEANLEEGLLPQHSDESSEHSNNDKYSDTGSTRETAPDPPETPLRLDLDRDLDHDNDSNSGNSNSECDSSSSRTLNETHSFQESGVVKDNDDDSSPSLPEEPANNHDNNEVTPIDPDQPQEDELRELPSKSFKKKDLSIDVPTQKEIASLPSPNDVKTPKDRITASSSTKSFESVSRLIEGYSEEHEDSPNGSVKTPKSNFFDFHKDDTFDRFLNDHQDTPPRGDVAVVGNKIRKHERSVSSISSFNSIVNDSKREISYVDANSPAQKRKSGRTISLDRSSLPPPEASVLDGSPKDNETRKSSEIKLKAQPAAPPQVVSSPTLSTTSEHLSTPKARDVDSNDTILENNRPEQSPEPPAPISKDSTPKRASNGTRSMLSVLEEPKNMVKTSAPAIPKKDNTVKTPSLNRDRNKALPLQPPASLPDIPVDQNKEINTAAQKSPSRKSNTPQVTKSPTKPKSMSNIAPSMTTANFKLFWKKFKSDKPVAAKPQPKATSEKKKPFFVKVPKFRQSEEKNTVTGFKAPSFEPPAQPRAQPAGQPAARDLVLVRNSIYDLTLTKLPTIDTDTSLLDDVLNSFNETLGSDKGKGNVDGITKDPFLRDDELTRDQIEDQQKRDRLANDDVDEDGEDELDDDNNALGHKRGNSDDNYIDENLRFLQEELLWPIDADFKPLDEASIPARRKSYELIRRSLVFDSEPDSETFVLENFELKNLFENTTEQQRKRLPFHLKHIGQFSDFDRLEILAEKFSMTPDVTKPKPSKAMQPSLRTKRSRGPRKKVEFAKKISITETFSPDFYKRYNKAVTQYTLTESLEILRIKSELNTYKCNEMLVHEDSQQNTHFFY